MREFSQHKYSSQMEIQIAFSYVLGHVLVRYPAKARFKKKVTKVIWFGGSLRHISFGLGVKTVVLTERRKSALAECVSTLV